MSAKKKSGIFVVLTDWRDFRLKIFAEGIIIGLFAGITVVLFRYALEKAELLRDGIYVFIKANGIWAAAAWFMALVIVALLLGFIVKNVPMAKGSGVPQVKGVILRQLETDWLKMITGTFIGGVLAIGAGMSLGRQGPSIQLGASVGQGVSRLLGRLKIEEKYLVTSGASAGLAAAFNAPLAGVIFALEELHKNFSPAVLMSAMAASLTADLVTQQFFGHQPFFDFRDLPVLPHHYFLLIIGLGLVTGVFGVFFNWCLIKAPKVYSRQKWVPKMFVSIYPLVIGGVLGFILPEVLGGGDRLLNSIHQGNFGLQMLIVLAAAKFIFTMISFGSGVPGGIFLPLLVIGALTGAVYGNTVIELLHVNSLYCNNFVVMAMAAYFTAIVKAPVTGSILITEMTGSFHHLLALVTVSMTAYLVSDILKSKPVYELLLEQILAKKGAADTVGDDKKKVIIDVVVSMGSSLEGRMVKDIKWPRQCLIVGIRRGESELIPRGDTRILAGDYLNVLLMEGQEEDIRNALFLMAADTY